jgi:hypothetical protein
LPWAFSLYHALRNFGTISQQKGRHGAIKKVSFERKKHDCQNQQQIPEIDWISDEGSHKAKVIETFEIDLEAER